MHPDFNSLMVFEFSPVPCLTEAQLCSQATLDRPATYILRVPEALWGGSHAEQPLAVLSPGLFYVPPLPSIWALRNTVFRRDAVGRDSMDMETLIHIQVLEKMAELELCQG